jgi:energy-coupling factor transport system ATP-binding protein
VIAARGVVIRHGAPPPLAGPLDLDLAPGERVELLGRSGAGKSSLLAILAGLLPPADGHVLIDGEPAGPRSTRRHVATRVGLLFQDPASQLLATRVADEIAFGLEQLGWPAASIRERVAKVARELDLGAHLERAPRTLSGGEMQRVALAAAVAPGPAYLLLDEPFAHLDPGARAEVAVWIERAARERSALLLGAAPRPGVLPAHPVSSAAADAAAVPNAVAASCAAPRRIVLAGGGIAHDGAGELPAAFAAHLAGAEGPPPRRELPACLAPEGAGATLAARGLAIGWAGQAIARDLDLELVPGAIVTLTGRNGAGKSALLATLAGLLAPLAGQIALAPAAALRARVSLALQFAGQLFYRSTVAADLADWGTPPAVAAALALVGLGPEMLGASPFRLSGGEVRRLALAAQLSTRRPFLLLDEPGAGLDGPGFGHLVAAIHAFAGAGGAVLIASHDEELLALGGTRLVLADGRLVGAG